MSNSDATYAIRLPKDDLANLPLIFKQTSECVYFTPASYPETSWYVLSANQLKAIDKSHALAGELMTLDELLMALSDKPILQKHILRLEV